MRHSMKTIYRSAPARLLNGLCICLLLTGCGLLDDPGPGEVVRAEGATAQRLVAYYHWTQAADQESLAAQLEMQEVAWQERQEASAGLRLALLLSVPADANDAALARAGDILAEVVEAPGSDNGVHEPFASLWREVLEQRRGLRAELRELDRRNAEQRSEIARLNEQIDALTSIERQLNIRERQQETPGEQNP